MLTSTFGFNFCISWSPLSLKFMPSLFPLIRGSTLSPRWMAADERANM